jgi:hypothetical protein
MSFQSSRDRSAVTLVSRQPGKRVSWAVLDESVRGLRDLARAMDKVTTRQAGGVGDSLIDCRSSSGSRGSDSTGGRTRCL